MNKALALLVFIVFCLVACTYQSLGELKRSDCNLPEGLNIQGSINGHTIHLIINNSTKDNWKMDLEYSAIVNTRGWRTALTDNFAGRPAQTKVLLPPGAAKFTLYPATLQTETDQEEKDTHWKPWPMGEVKFVLLFKDPVDKEITCSLVGNIVEKTQTEP